MFLCWLQITTRPFPCECFFTCRCYVGARRAQTNSRVNFRTIRLTCPLFLTTCSYFLNYLPTLTLQTLPVVVVVVVVVVVEVEVEVVEVAVVAVLNFTYFWNFRQAGSQKIQRTTQAKPAPHQLGANVTPMCVFCCVTGGKKLQKLHPQIRKQDSQLPSAEV